ncbi:MAG: helix-turn-helix domain-containing protein [Gaiellaceae bacterium]
MFEIGNSLREARLRQQLDFPEIERATKIRAKYLRALEEESFDDLPAQTYVKGFLRTYADHLGLDGQLYLDEYNSRYVTGEDELPAVRPPRRHTAPGFGPIQRRSVVLAVLAIAAVAGLVIVAWKFGSTRGQSYHGVNSVSQKTAPAHQRAAVRPPQRRVPAVAHLVLHAVNGACWIRAFRGSASGQQLYEGTLEPGKTLPLSARRLYLQVGNPAAVTATVNGKLGTWPSQTAVNVIVTAAGIRRATKTA